MKDKYAWKISESCGMWLQIGQWYLTHGLLRAIDGDFHVGVGLFDEHFAKVEYEQVKD
jgi:hypothetical protein